MQYDPDDLVVIIPLYNEAHYLQSLLNSLKEANLRKVIFGVSPNSSDDTKLILERNRLNYTQPFKDGYDLAVEDALEKVDSYYPESELILFADAHHKFSEEVILEFINEINTGADLVLGIKEKNQADQNWYQELGSKLIVYPLQIFFRRQIREITPFRMIKRDLIEKFSLEPKKYRVPAEIIVKSLAMNLKIIELPVDFLSKHESSNNFQESLEKNLDPLTALQFINYKPKTKS